MKGFLFQFELQEKNIAFIHIFLKFIDFCTYVAMFLFWHILYNF